MAVCGYLQPYNAPYLIHMILVRIHNALFLIYKLLTERHEMGRISHAKIVQEGTARQRQRLLVRCSLM